MLTRRDVIKGALAMGALAPLTFSPILQAATKLSGNRSGGFYAMQFGEFKLTALSDGIQHLPLEKLLTHTSPDYVRWALKQDSIPTPVPVSTNSFLLETGSRRVLIDTGAGSLLKDDIGHLVSSLRSSGYTPEQVTDVVITHMHVDHVGGLVNSGAMSFPNAQLHISRTEYEHWLDPAKRAVAVESQQETFTKSPEMIAPYKQAGRLQLAESGDTIMPGVTLISRPGHTPGSLEIKVESRGQTMMFLGDMLHSEQVQFSDPSIAFTYDENESAAIASRRAVFAEAAKNGYWIAFAHVSFPGIGQIRQRGDAYDWIPVTYGVDV